MRVSPVSFGTCRIIPVNPFAYKGKEAELSEYILKNIRKFPKNEYEMFETSSMNDREQPLFTKDYYAYAKKLDKSYHHSMPANTMMVTGVRSLDKGNIDYFITGIDEEAEYRFANILFHNSNRQLTKEDYWEYRNPIDRLRCIEQIEKTSQF